MANSNNLSLLVLFILFLIKCEVHLNKKISFFQYLKPYILLVLIYFFIDTLLHCIYKCNTVKKLLMYRYSSCKVVCAVSSGTPFNLVIETKLFAGTHKPNPDL